MTEHKLQRPGPETPDLYEQDGLGRKAIVHEHYFIGGCDWWITEYNKEKDIAFGFACLGDPQSAKLVDSAGMQVLLYLIPVAGVLVIIAAIIGYSSSKKRAGTVKTLQQSGYKTTGVIVDIQSQHHGAGANDSGYKIVVSATNGSGIVNNYVSDELYSIGGLAMIDFRTNPVPIDVYIDTVNPENYYVEVDDIPNLTPDRIADMIKTVVKPAEYTSINANSQNPAQPNSVSVPLPQQPQAFNQPNTAPIVSQEQQAPQNGTTQYNDRT